MSYPLGQIEADPDEYFTEPQEPEARPRRRGLIAAAGGLLVMGVFAGGLWFAYHQGLRHAGAGVAGDVPLIRADARPTKVKPENPGGMEVPDRDKLIYTQKRAAVEHLLPPPEKPLPRPTAPPPPVAKPEIAQVPAAAVPEGGSPAVPVAPPAAKPTGGPKPTAAQATAPRACRPKRAARGFSSVRCAARRRRGTNGTASGGPIRICSAACPRPRPAPISAKRGCTTAFRQGRSPMPTGSAAS